MNEALCRDQMALTVPVSAGGVFTGTFEGDKKLIQSDRGATNKRRRVDVSSSDSWIGGWRVVAR